MPLDPSHLLGIELPSRTVPYNQTETLLYALSLGAGLRDDLTLVQEDGQRVMPTFVQNLAFDDSWLEEVGIDLRKVVHGALDLSFERPVPCAGEVEVKPAVVGLADKGPGKGAILLQETKIIEGGSLLATSRSSLFVRGEGGFGGDKGQKFESVSIPASKSDLTIEAPTRPDQALLFRLLGDRNPLHVSPDAARALGFERPILHGACTIGTACLAILPLVPTGDPAVIHRFGARFVGPLYPGETLLIDIWKAEYGLTFKARAAHRNAPVLDGGIVEFKTSSRSAA